MMALHWLSWAACLYLAWTAQSQFNSTVQFTVDSMDPMCDLDYPWTAGQPFTLDEEIGYRTSTGRSSGKSGCFFVGTGFQVRGRVYWTPFYANASNRNGFDDHASATLLYPFRSEWDQSTENRFAGVEKNDTNLYGQSSLDLHAYKLMFNYAGVSRLEFHNLTVDVPIRTQAPSLRELESQAEYAPAVKAERLNGAMSVSQNSVTQDEVDAGVDLTRAYFEHNYLPIQSPPSNASTTASNATLEKRRDVNFDVMNDTVLLKNYTELSYTAPSNTTLIRVYGPVGIYTESFYGSRCYATLDPHPAWWRNLSFPQSGQYKVRNETNRTMFLLPVDPTVRTTVRIGPVGNMTSCWVSGISSYPFHYNYTLADMLADGSAGPSGGGNGSTSESGNATMSGGSNKTGIIVGVVVGVGGALILAALAFWLFRQHRAKKRKEESRSSVAPYVVSEKELYRTASWSPHNADGSGASTTPERRPRESDEDRPPRRIVREQDAEEYEVLPPLYREWQPRQESNDQVQDPAVSSPPPQSSDLSSPPAPNAALSSSHKGDYFGAFSQPSGSSGGQRSRTTTPPETPPLKEDYARMLGVGDAARPVTSGVQPASQDTSQGDKRLLPTPQGPRDQREAGTSNGQTPVRQLGEANSFSLKGDYKRAFL